jgi:hypothetical protein
MKAQRFISRLPCNSSKVLAVLGSAIRGPAERTAASPTLLRPVALFSLLVLLSQIRS